MNLKRDGKPTQEDGGVYLLTIEGDSPDCRLRATVRTVLEYLDFVISRNGPDDNQIYFELTCQPARLETFARMLFETQPAPFRKLDIKLQGNDTTTADMNVISNSSPNIIPKATCHVPNTYAKETRAKDPSELVGFVTAELMRSMMDYFGGSCNGYDSARKEFTCSVEVGYNIRGSGEDGKQVWKKRYPSSGGLNDLVDDMSLGDDDSYDDWTDEE